MSGFEDDSVDGDYQMKENDGEIPRAPGSPTPTRRRAASPGTRNSVYNGSPGSSPRRTRATYGDRYIPNRTGVNLHAAFNLAQDDMRSQANDRHGNINEIEYQKVEEANRTFSTVLKAELFSGEVPSAIPNLTPSSSGMADSSSNSRSSSSTPRTPPRMTKSASTTPNRNIFKYRSPNKQRTTVNVTADGLSNTRGGELSNIQHEIYSLSPVGMDSQRLLLSPKKTTRSIPNVPYKVLDAPDLQDDFYLNLVDWGDTDVLAVALGKCVYLWDAASGNVNKLCSFDTAGDIDEEVTSVLWIKGGVQVAVGTTAGLVYIWDTEKKTCIRTMTGHEGRVASLSWNGYMLSSGSKDRTILHRDVRSQEHYIERVIGHKQEVCGLKWNSDLNQLASGGNDNHLIVWNGLDRQPLYKFSDHSAAVKAIDWSPHQRGLLASGGGTADRRIRFWNTLTGSSISEIDTGSQVCNILWSRNSNELVSTHGYSKNQVTVWKYPSMRQVAALTGHIKRVLYLSMSPDGRTIVSGAGDETLRFWNVFNENKTSNLNDSSLLDVFQQLR